MFVKNPLKSIPIPGEAPIRVALEKDSLDVWVGGSRIETEAGFTEEGSEQIFTVENQEARILGKNLFSKISRFQ